MPGIRRTEKEKALAKELGTHTHFPNLWIHVMNQSEYDAVLRCADALQFPTKLIGTETIHVHADNSDRITMIFKKPEPFEQANYRKWEQIKAAIYLRRKKFKEYEEMRKKEDEPIELHVNWGELGCCNFCHESVNGDMNDDLIARDIKLSNGALLMQANVFITDKGGLELYLDDPSGDKLDTRVVKIHYCPMCGRKLEYNDRIKITNEEFSYDDPEFLMSLDLSVRSHNCLSRAGILSINDFCTLTADSLAEVRNLGRHSYIEIAYALREHGVIIADILKTAAMYKSSMKSFV